MNTASFPCVHSPYRQRMKVPAVIKMALVSYRCTDLHLGGMTLQGKIRAPDRLRARVGQAPTYVDAWRLPRRRRRGADRYAGRSRHTPPPRRPVAIGTARLPH